MKKCRSLLLLALLFLLLLTGCAATGRIVDVANGKTISPAELLARAEHPPIIVIGEIHDSRIHHRIQLEIIKALHESGKELVVGMEMFRAISQPALDAWIDGQISAEDFQRIYQDNWQNLPWDLYAEIMLYAREHAIPVLGLNLPRAIIKKVAQQGFGSLSRAEKADLPSGITCEVHDDYMELMNKVYPQHGNDRQSFLNFCQAQLLWDKSMAYRVARFLQDRPQTAMVVLIGGGHARKHGGMPEQLANMLPERRPVVLMPDLPEINEGGRGGIDADYLIIEE